MNSNLVKFFISCDFKDKDSLDQIYLIKICMLQNEYRHKTEHLPDFAFKINQR